MARYWGKETSGVWVQSLQFRPPVPMRVMLSAAPWVFQTSAWDTSETRDSLHYRRSSSSVDPHRILKRDFLLHRYVTGCDWTVLSVSPHSHFRRGEDMHLTAILLLKHSPSVTFQLLFDGVCGVAVQRVSQASDRSFESRREQDIFLYII